MQFLRQSTASQIITIGPLAKSSDGTAQTGLTIANTDIKLRKNAGTSLVNKNSGGATELASGEYYATLDATDTDTLGRFDVTVAAASTLVWKNSFMVLPPLVYDALVLGSDYSLFGIPNIGTAAAIANGTITLASGHGITNTASVAIWLLSGTNAKGKSRIATYSGSGDVFNVSPAWNANGETTPSGTIVYAVQPLPLASTSDPIPVDVSKWNGTAVATPATAGYPVATLKVGTGTGELNLASGKVPATLAAGDIANSAITAAALALDAGSEIATALLVAAASDPINANIQKINDVPVTGDGSSGNKFGV